MAEREIVGNVNTLSQEEKDASTKEALNIARDAQGKMLISDKHGMLNQNALMEMSDDEITKRMVEIADRGFTSFRLKVPLPDDWYGEWAPSDPASIAEYHMKGFIIDDKFAPQHALHSDATGKPIVGDVIHMICPTRIKQAHDRAAQIRYDRVHGKRKNLPEETQYEANVKNLGLDTKYKNTDINTSTQERISQSDILKTVQGGS